MTHVKTQDVNDREKLENHHSRNLLRIYEIYSLLRDYYNHYKTKKMNDSEVGAVMSKFLSGKFYRRNKKCLEDALIIIQKVYRVRIREIPDDKSEHKIILCAAKEHKTYIKRMILVLDEIVCSKKIQKLKEEISLFGDKIVF